MTSTIYDLTEKRDELSAQENYIGTIGGPGTRRLNLYRYDDGPEPQLGLGMESSHGLRHVGPLYLTPQQARILAKWLCDTYGFGVEMVVPKPYAAITEIGGTGYVDRPWDELDDRAFGE